MTDEHPERSTNPTGQAPVPTPTDEWSFAPSVPGEQLMGEEARPTYKLAGWWSRAGAFIIDRLITYAVATILFVIGGVAVSNANAAGIVVGILLFLLALVFVAVYAPVLVARKGPANGQTLGKQLLGIRAMRNDGKPYDMGNAFLREFLCKGILPNVASATVIGILATPLNFLWPLWDDENRAVHDLIASSHVVDNSAS